MDAGLGSRFLEARLRAQLRLRKKLTQGDMAQLVTDELARLGSERTVSQPQWSDYESGKSEPRQRIVYTAVANVSGLDAGYLAFGESVRHVAEARPDPFGGSDMGIPKLDLRDVADVDEEPTTKRKPKRRGKQAG